ncbi:MAG: type II toxin-antitoxin system RelE/ParE family toxin [Bacilli bacterium]|nr:type II toxin-antitoxin system RelE/ParE family toxin [Bacilli bacterium]
MKYKVFISEDARNSILDSMRFLANVNKNSAKKELDNIFKEIHSLEQFPLRHPIVPDLIILGKQTYKFILSSGRYIVLYTVSNTDVFINKFLDARRDNKIINDLT